MFFLFRESFLQATSDKTASANFTQTGETVGVIGIIGDVTGTAYGRTGYNLYYQHGRKDAFRSNEYTTAPASGTTLMHSSAAVTVGKAIQTPTTHYHGGTAPQIHAYTPFYYNAWNATYTTYSTATDKIDGLEKVVKTVYDPCPVGYTVPPANTFSSFTTTNFTIDGKGRKYTYNGKTLYFQSIGRREGSTANFNCTDYCNYWESIFATVAYGRTLNSESPTTLCTHGLYSSHGMSIRPVSENVRQH